MKGSLSLVYLLKKYNKISKLQKYVFEFKIIINYTLCISKNKRII